jgi:hypothetical protein
MTCLRDICLCVLHHKHLFQKGRGHQFYGIFVCLIVQSNVRCAMRLSCFVIMELCLAWRSYPGCKYSRLDRRFNIEAHVWRKHVRCSVAVSKDQRYACRSASGLGATFRDVFTDHAETKPNQVVESYECFKSEITRMTAICTAAQFSARFNAEALK